MARIFRPKIIRYVDAKGKRCPKTTHGARRVTTNNKFWFAEYVDANDQPRRESLKVSNKDLAQKMLSEIIHRIERERAGDRYVSHEATQLLCPNCESLGFVKRDGRNKVKCDQCAGDDAPHVSCFRRHLQNKRNTPGHVRQSCSRIAKIFRECKLSFWNDITASRVDQFLADLRASGISVTTSNYYLQAVNEFCNWMHRNRRASENPINHLRPLNAEADIRRERRPLSTDEFSRLIDATRKSKKIFRKLSGIDRAMLYLTAAYTGLRASELASLSKLNLYLQDGMPIARVNAAYSKRKRTDFQPLRQDLATELEQWLEGKKAEATDGREWHRRPTGFAKQPCPICGIDEIRVGEHRATDTGWVLRSAGGKRLKPVPGEPKLDTVVDGKLWPLSWPQKAADMIRSDLEEARTRWIQEAKSETERAVREQSDYLAYENQRGEVFDFHALRHHFITSLGKAGIDGGRRQELARHSTLRLTDKYTHLALHDVHGAIDALPPLPQPQRPDSEQATGTDGKALTQSESQNWLRHGCASTRQGMPNGAVSGQIQQNATAKIEAETPEESATPKPLTDDDDDDGQTSDDRSLRIANPLFAGSNPAGASWYERTCGNLRRSLFN